MLGQSGDVGVIPKQGRRELAAQQLLELTQELQCAHRVEPILGERNLRIDAGLGHTKALRKLVRHPTSKRLGVLDVHVAAALPRSKKVMSSSCSSFDGVATTPLIRR